MDKSDELLERCFQCKDYPNDCGIYFMMALWGKECKFFRKKMSKYQEFLNKCNIISEELFNDIINSLPECNISDINFYRYDVFSQDEISAEIINSILKRWDEVYVDGIDFENKVFEVGDVQTLKDLKEIAETFPKWTISNYSECREALISDGKEGKERLTKQSIIDSVIDNISLEELKEIAKKYAY